MSIAASLSPALVDLITLVALCVPSALTCTWTTTVPLPAIAMDVVPWCVSFAGENSFAYCATAGTAGREDGQAGQRGGEGKVAFHRLPLRATMKRALIYTTSPGAGKRRPTAAATSASLPISEANCSKVSDCIPSETALAGSGCTSTKSPSAPAATPARDIGSTKRATPVPCDGSTITGRWVNSASSGTTARSSTLRVAESNERKPRSHRTTLRVAGEQQVLGGHQPLVDGRGEAALQEHRFARRARPRAAARSSACCARRSAACPRTRRRSRRRADPTPR